MSIVDIFLDSRKFLYLKHGKKKKIRNLRFKVTSDINLEKKIPQKIGKYGNKTLWEQIVFKKVPFLFSYVHFPVDHI